jgi:hypothetical protein
MMMAKKRQREFVKLMLQAMVSGVLLIKQPFRN